MTTARLLFLLLVSIGAPTLCTAAPSAQNVLILTDASGAAVNGGSHVSDVIAAFTNTGASITTNTTELTNGSADRCGGHSRPPVDAAVDGPMAVIAPGSGTSACVLMITDVTEFWVSGGLISSLQANALATDFLNSAMSCGAATPTRARTRGSTKALYR